MECVLWNIASSNLTPYNSAGIPPVSKTPGRFVSSSSAPKRLLPEKPDSDK